MASALLPDAFDGAELGRLLAGGALVLSACALIPRGSAVEPGVRLSRSR